MNGQTYDRGVAVHSRCILTYDLNGRYSTFEALVGFDDAVERDRDASTAGSSPTARRSIPIPTCGPTSRRSSWHCRSRGPSSCGFMVDFGRGQDTGDRVIWANARLHRVPHVGRLGRQQSRGPRCRSEIGQGGRKPITTASLNREPSTHMRTFVVRSIGLSARALFLCRRSPPSQGNAKDKDNRSRRSRSTNGRSGSAIRPRRRSTRRAIYKNAMPTVVGTSRPKFEDKELAGKFADRADLGRAVLRRGPPRCRRRPAGEEGLLPLALAGEQRARRPAPMVQVGSVHDPARRHPAELSPGNALASEAARQHVGPVPQVRVSFRALHRLRRRADDPDPVQDPGRSR